MLDVEDNSLVFLLPRHFYHLLGYLSETELVSGLLKEDSCLTIGESKKARVGSNIAIEVVDGQKEFTGKIIRVHNDDEANGDIRNCFNRILGRNNAPALRSAKSIC
jgi:hypothetical protein